MESVSGEQKSHGTWCREEAEWETEDQRKNRRRRNTTTPVNSCFY